ncbi:MAG: FdrA family protein [Actinobacteria bacterium]|nr:FdrA family protein [Actinomycetota bacterium]MBM3698148.1 FdrA family protein [Actinomycetota bacterium]
MEDLPQADDVVVELRPGVAAGESPAAGDDAAPEADALAVIGVPGAFAALEGHRALSAGSNVMLLTGDVVLADEVALKRRAADAGRLVLGPGSDTAIIDGVGIGIANVVAAGRIGVVATSGSGAQEASVLLDRFGLGVSRVLVTGPRDLTDEVGAASSIAAMRRMADDPLTDAVVLVAEGFSARGAEAALAALAACGKPGSACMLGAEGLSAPDGVELHGVIDQAVVAAARRAGARPVIPAAEPTGWVSAGHVRGIFSGSALCAEAAAVLAARLGRVVSNTPAGAAEYLDPRDVVRGNACLDLQAESTAHGTPHPLLDPSRRAGLIGDTVSDQTVAVILLDIILGRGAHPDPAGALAPAIADALQARPSLQVVAHVCGTEADPQVLSRQEDHLTRAGARVAPTSAQAARLAAALVRPAR